MNSFFQEIRRTGIKPATDKRLKKVIENMSKYRSKQNISLETLNLDLDQFKFVLSGNLPLLIKIFRNDLVIPEFASFCESVTTLYQKLKNNFNGEVSSTHCYFTRLNLKNMGPLQFCLPAFLGTF